jgi:hypothetical protein
MGWRYRIMMTVVIGRLLPEHGVTIQLEALVQPEAIILQ